MKRLITAAAVAFLAAACAPPEPAAPTRPPTRYVPPPQSAYQTPRPRPPRYDNSDQCGARPMQYLVGRPRGEIPVPVEPNRRRVACTTCPVTQDFRPDRLNLFYEAETGIIKEVKCG